jgi:hypothetical protein
MRLLLDRAVPVGTPIGVQSDAKLVLGEVCYCNGLPEGNKFAVGLELEHALANTADLARLAHRLLGFERQPASLQSGDSVANGRHQNRDQGDEQEGA